MEVEETECNIMVVGCWLILVSHVTHPLPFFVIGTAAIQIANDPIKHELTKHIGVDVFFTRSCCQQSTIHLEYVPSELQLADFFRKAQTKEDQKLHVLKLNVSNPP